RPGRPAFAVVRYSTLEEARKKATLAKLRRITSGVLRGMDVAKEVEIVDGLALGDTLVLEKGRDVVGFALYHVPGVSEAPPGAVYVKFLAVDPGQRRLEYLQALLGAVEDMALGAQVQRGGAPGSAPHWAAYAPR